MQAGHAPLVAATGSLATGTCTGCRADGGLQASRPCSPVCAQGEGVVFLPAAKRRCGRGAASGVLLSQVPDVPTDAPVEMVRLLGSCSLARPTCEAGHRTKEGDAACTPGQRVAPRRTCSHGRYVLSSLTCGCRSCESLIESMSMLALAKGAHHGCLPPHRSPGASGRRQKHPPPGPGLQTCSEFLVVGGAAAGQLSAARLQAGRSRWHCR